MFCRRALTTPCRGYVNVQEIIKMADFLFNSLKMLAQFLTFKPYLNAMKILNSKFLIIYLFCRTRKQRAHRLYRYTMETLNCYEG
jgi:hypothetical protein